MRVLVLVVFVHLAFAATVSADIIHNPHGETGAQDCLYCHTPQIYEVGGRPGDPHLVFTSIDNLCLSCHLEEDCCRLDTADLAKLHIGEFTHPSDIRVRETQHKPNRLPVFSGRITCSTCHLHVRDDPRNVNRVRLVETYGDGGLVDWTPLCNDCHEDY